MQTKHPQKPEQMEPAPPATEAQLMAADMTVQLWKAGHHERNDRRALELQVRANACQWGVA